MENSSRARGFRSLCDRSWGSVPHSGIQVAPVGVPPTGHRTSALRPPLRDAVGERVTCLAVSLRRSFRAQAEVSRRRRVRASQPLTDTVSDVFEPAHPVGWYRWLRRKPRWVNPWLTAQSAFICVHLRLKSNPWAEFVFLRVHSWLKSLPVVLIRVNPCASVVKNSLFGSSPSGFPWFSPCFCLKQGLIIRGAINYINTSRQ